MEPWEIKTDDSRTEDGLPLFVIFCEDEVSEYIYFKYFETNRIKVNIIRKNKSKMPHVMLAIKHCMNEGYTEIREGVEYLKQEIGNIWCVYDRDYDENTGIEQNISFNTSIRTAEEKGMKVAWSNDAFELWVLLHFEDINPDDNALKYRANYYEKLTQYFKNIPDKTELLSKILLIKNFNYKKHFKGDNNFRNIVRFYMIPHTKLAIDRAKVLNSKFEIDGSLPFHDRGPCTLVFKLVEELIEQGGREI